MEIVTNFHKWSNTHFTFLAKYKSYTSLSVFGRQYLSRSYYFFATCSVSESERYDHSVTNSIYKNPMWPSFFVFFLVMPPFSPNMAIFDLEKNKKVLTHVFSVKPSVTNSPYKLLNNNVIVGTTDLMYFLLLLDLQWPNTHLRHWRPWVPRFLRQ